MKTKIENGKCYFCSDPINGPAVEWQETNNYKKNPTAKGVHRILLHPKCACMLGERLIGDAFSADPQVEEKDIVLYLIESRMRQRN